MKTIDKIKSLLEKLPHKIQVSFALHCAEDVYPLTKNSKEAKLCIDLVKEWLSSPDRPGLEKELKAAADAAYNTAHSAAYAAHDAVRAAYVTAHDAVRAAYNADTAAAYTILAANAAANAAGQGEKLQEYHDVLVGYLTEVEKVLYSLEEK
jgi:DNA polymerase I-like protein with 3'-5' exonuclease and polymerase domains